MARMARGVTLAEITRVKGFLVSFETKARRLEV